MAFEVVRRVIAAVVVLRLDVDHDLGASRLGPGVMRIDVIDHPIDALRDGPTFLWCCNQTSILRLDIAKHVHAVAKRELCMSDFSSLSAPPSSAQNRRLRTPIDVCRCVPVARRRNDSPSEAYLLLDHDLVP